MAWRQNFCRRVSCWLSASPPLYPPTLCLSVLSLLIGIVSVYLSRFVSLFLPLAFFQPLSPLSLSLSSPSLSTTPSPVTLKQSILCMLSQVMNVVREISIMTHFTPHLHLSICCTTHDMLCDTSWGKPLLTLVCRYGGDVVGGFLASED